VVEDDKEDEMSKDVDFQLIAQGITKQNDVDPLYSSPRGLGTTACRICLRSIENLKQF